MGEDPSAPRSRKRSTSPSEREAWRRPLSLVSQPSECGMDLGAGSESLCFLRERSVRHVTVRCGSWRVFREVRASTNNTIVWPQFDPTSTVRWFQWRHTHCRTASSTARQCVLAAGASLPQTRLPQTRQGCTGGTSPSRLSDLGPEVVIAVLTPTPRCASTVIDLQRVCSPLERHSPTVLARCRQRPRGVWPICSPANKATSQPSTSTLDVSISTRPRTPIISRRAPWYEREHVSSLCRCHLHYPSSRRVLSHSRHPETSE